MKKSSLLSLPPELRNHIYEVVAADTERLIIRRGSTGPHPFNQVCHQIQDEFGSIFAACIKDNTPTVEPRTILIQLENFDFTSTVQAIDRCLHSLKTIFEVEVRISKQLYRRDWEKVWPWVHFCDELARQGDGSHMEIQSKYSIRGASGVCNSHVARHELYIESVPYILHGNSGGAQTSAGYRQIEKIRAAIGGGILL
ncbi:hypothetical protein DOTSEDRAFT_67593 [Dothistroma septosporum NZE10]|uniref:F-box domain-containing protein n=1 Tax=Dothistroma septosporum (strain NZE10 / CBS 128990) TaxID=675120 RepID=N1PYV0_DOTSN|nr:hypothetical protein DOTSEDRAFT_67593 [Dothistroma septosporum NZE10]